MANDVRRSKSLYSGFASVVIAFPRRKVEMLVPRFDVIDGLG